MAVMLPRIDASGGTIDDQNVAKFRGTRCHSRLARLGLRQQQQRSFLADTLWNRHSGSDERCHGYRIRDHHRERVEWSSAGFDDHRLVAAPMNAALQDDIAVLLSNGKVLLAGGGDGHAATATTDLYTP
jgi:hypothetical protein